MNQERRKGLWRLIARYVESTEAVQHVSGVKGKSVLFNLDGFDVIKDLPPDPLDQLYLGVVRRLISLWFDRENHSSPFYIGSYVSEIDEILKQFKIPCSIPRIPRSTVY